MRAVRALPELVRASYLADFQKTTLSSGLFAGRGVEAASAGRDERLLDAEKAVYTIRLFGVIPLRTVTALPDGGAALMPGGTAVGITILTDGTLVVGLGAVDTADGKLSPGAAAGLCPGDRIVEVDGRKVTDAAHLTKLCSEAGEEMLLTVEREGETLSLRIRPASTLDGTRKLGVWVRDSTAGVGTLSFVEPEKNWFAALGHAVSDVDTHAALTIREGNILPSTIIDIIPGAQGEPGELSGVFAGSGGAIGAIALNTEYGIFGPMSGAYENGFCGPLPLGLAAEAHVGPAKLLSTISDGGVKAYECEIIRVSVQKEPSTKGMVLQITDQDLIQSAGGIVQGMSGSPVLQDGRLIGVVTHVFVNDPTRGYCVYAEWMQSILTGAAS